MALDVTITIEDNAGIITLSGDLDRNTSQAFQDAVVKAAEAGVSRLVLNLEGLDYMASAGLRVLIFAKQKMGAESDIYVVAPQELVLETIEKTGFIDSVIVVDSYPPV